MSNGNLKTSHEPATAIRAEENELELTQWNASAIEAEAEPEKYRSRLRIIAVLAGLNVSHLFPKSYPANRLMLFSSPCSPQHWIKPSLLQPYPR